MAFRHGKAWAVEGLGEASQEGLHEQGEVLHALAQGRHADGEDVEPVVEVLPEAAGIHHVPQAAVGGRNDAGVEVAGALLADAAVLALLQGPQKLALLGDHDFADLVQEEGAPFGGLEEADVVGVGAGEGALDVAEELALEELVGDGGAVDLDEGAGLGLAVGMDFVGHHLLARAGLPGDEHDGPGGGHVEDLLLDALDGGTLADDALEAVPAVHGALEVGVFDLELALEPGELVEGPGVGDADGKVVGRP